MPITVWLQKQLPPILLGRVFSVLGTIGLATAPIGVLLFGFISNLNTDNLNLLNHVDIYFNRYNGYSFKLLIAQNS